MIEVNNLTSFAVDKKFFTGVAKKVLKGENREREHVSIAFVSSAEIQKLNRTYRKKDSATDVLSFEKISTFKDECSEVIICPEIVREQARGFEISLKRALAKALIHGLLHVLGYDHEISSAEEERMFKKEEYYIAKIYAK